MNEPANWGKGDVKVGCANNKWNNPPYVPRKKMMFTYAFGKLTTLDIKITIFVTSYCLLLCRH